jgi:hypothetical protein
VRDGHCCAEAPGLVAVEADRELSGDGVGEGGDLVELYRAARRLRRVGRDRVGLLVDLQEEGGIGPREDAQLAGQGALYAVLAIAVGSSRQQARDGADSLAC